MYVWVIWISEREDANKKHVIVCCIRFLILISHSSFPNAVHICNDCLDHFPLHFISLFCIRVCTNANSTYSAAAMCWHELDEMGCEFVMPGNYQVNGTL